MAYVKLPVGEMDPVIRLKKVEKDLTKLSNSTLPIASFIFSRVIGCSFHWMISFGVYHNIYTPTLAAPTVPGPKCKEHFWGHQVVDCHSALGPMMRGLGVMFNTLTYDNYFKARFLVNEKILNKKSDVEEMTKNMIQEFHRLKCCADSIV